MSDELIVCRESTLSKAIEDAIAPLHTENAVVKRLCQQALNLARQHASVLEVVHDQNLLLRTALMRLLDDTQHAKHNCGDSPEECPVAYARMVLRGPVKQ